MNTNFRKFFQNPHETAEKTTSQELAEERLRMELTDMLEVTTLPYSESRKPYYRAALWLANLGNVYSFFTGAFCGTFLLLGGLGFLPQSVAFVIAGILGIGTTLILEYSKRYVNQRYFFNALFLKRIDPSAGLALLVLMTISIGSSVYTSTLLPTTFSRDPNLSDADSIRTYYDTQIADKKATIKEVTEKGHWKGTLTKQSQETLLGLTASISELEKTRAVALEKVKAENEATLSAHKANNETHGWILGWITLASEIVFVFAFWYRVRYLYKSAAERKMFSSGNQSGSFNNLNTMPFEPTQPGQRPIGFFMNNAANQAQNPVITQTYEQKIFIKNTVKHIDKTNGESIELSSAEIQKRINTYSDRVNESLEKLKTQAGDEQIKTLQVLQDRIENLNYWNGKRDELLKNLEKMLP